VNKMSLPVKHDESFKMTKRERNEISIGYHYYFIQNEGR